MSEKCANCGQDAPEAYCPHCGQKTRIGLPTIPELIADGLAALFSYDGKLWRSIRELLLRPGGLTLDFLRGKRQPYLTPIQLFVWLQAITFLASTGAGPLMVTVDPYLGARYTYLDMELKGKLDLPDLGIDAHRTASQSEHWVDPMIGVRTAWDLGECWSLALAGDVGGISTSDQYSAEAYGTVGYHFSLFGADNATVLAGYRVLKQKYETGNGRDRFDWDMTIHGPIAGLRLTF